MGMETLGQVCHRSPTWRGCYHD